MKRLFLFSLLIAFICCTSGDTTIVKLYYQMPDDVGFGCDVMNIVDNKKTRDKCLNKESVTETYLEFVPSCGDGSREFLSVVDVGGISYLLLKQYFSSFSDTNFGLIVYEVGQNSVKRTDKNLFADDYVKVLNDIINRNEFPDYMTSKKNPGLTIELQRHTNDINVILHPEIGLDAVFGSFMLENGEYTFHVND